MECGVPQTLECAIGSNAIVLTHDFDCPINVSAADPNGPITRNLRTVSAALATMTQ